MKASQKGRIKIHCACGLWIMRRHLAKHRLSCSSIQEILAHDAVRHQTQVIRTSAKPETRANFFKDAC